MTVMTQHRWLSLALLCVLLLGSGGAEAGPHPEVLFSGKLLDTADKLRSALGLTQGMPPGPKVEARVIRYLDSLNVAGKLPDDTIRD